MTNMKRSLSDSESEDFCDDIIKPGSPGSQGCHGGMDRKRRRGVIEKRRRDRINNSLSELRRLVPAAFEKQGSAKLEKAEILQMTVDHLKVLHAKGLNGYGVDTAALAVDYRGVGFRECVAEVARYLITVEGMDIQDPLRLRLLSHLQCYSAQREAAAKASLQNTTWNSMGHHHSLNTQYNASQMSSMSASMISHPQHATHAQTDQLSTMASHAMSSYSDTRVMSTAHIPGDNNNTSGMPRLPSTVPSVGSQMGSSSSTGSQMPSSVLSGLPQVHTQFPVSIPGMSNMPMLSPSGTHYSTSSLGQVKPYRPWGAELAY